MFEVSVPNFKLYDCTGTNTYYTVVNLNLLPSTFGWMVPILGFIWKPTLHPLGFGGNHLCL